jgi:hypothetical protein
MKCEVLTEIIIILSPSSAPEDGNSMFLRKVGFDLEIHRAPNPKTSSATYKTVFCILICVF